MAVTWICKRCNQIFVDPYFSDNICEECYEEMKREEKKRKRQLKSKGVTKFMSVLTAFSLILCLFCGSGITAYAEETRNTPEIFSQGKYMEYDVIEYSLDSKLNALSIQQYYKKHFPEYLNNQTYIFLYLMAFDENGLPHFYSTYSNSLYVFSYWNPMDEREWASVAGNGVAIDVKKHGIEYSEVFYRVRSNDYKAWASYTELSSGESYGVYQTICYDNKNTFNGFCSDELYFVLVPYTHNVDNKDVIESKLLNGTREEYIPEIQYSQPEKPFIFSSMFPFEIDMSNAVDTGTGFIGVEYTNIENSGVYLDWLGYDGTPLNPYLTFDIHDNNFNHNYELIVSYNLEFYQMSLKALSEEYVKKENPFYQWCLNNDAMWLWDLSGNLSIHNPVDAFADSLEIFSRINLKSPTMTYFTESFRLNTSAFDFSTSSDNTYRRFKINLNDYMTVLNTCMYRVEWRDKTANEIIWTGYFATPNSYNRLTIPNGSSYYDYNYDNYNGDDLMQTLPDNSNIIQDSQVSGGYNEGEGGTIPSDPIDKPTIDENGAINWNDMTNLYYPLNFGLSGLTDFFNSVWCIFPNEIRSIILTSVSCVVILRLLGR